jgi:hypothetical protein
MGGLSYRQKGGPKGLPRIIGSSSAEPQNLADHSCEQMKSHRGSDGRSWNSDRTKKSGHFLFQFDPLFFRGMVEQSIPKSVVRVSKPHSGGKK